MAVGGAQESTRIEDVYYARTRAYCDLYFLPEKIVVVEMGSTWFTILFAIPLGLVIGILSGAAGIGQPGSPLIALIAFALVYSVYQQYTRRGRMKRRTSMSGVGSNTIAMAGSKSYEILRGDIQQVKFTKRGRVGTVTFFLPRPKGSDKVRFSLTGGKKIDSLRQAVTAFVPDKIAQ